MRQMYTDSVIIFALILGMSLAQMQKYNTKYDYLNVDQILRNNRLLKSYYKCLINEGPCTQEGMEFRRTFPDALRTQCKKCNPLQKKNARKIIEYVMKNKPDMWQGVLKKYDPTGNYTKKILEVLAEK